MANIPGWLLRHEATIEPLLGEGSHGPKYGPAVTVRCFRDDKRKLDRAAKGSELTSETTLYMRRTVTCPAGSRITLADGRVATAITVLDRSGGGLPTPDHLEVVLR